MKMYFFEEKTLKEIAVEENKSFSTIREIFRSGLKNMKTMLLNSGYKPESCNN
ncbi:MAG: sigma-70 family RNA polymerase sigma factor [Clostridia bacterium]|nr:sigma-70 family RNA polymerase sigma factor [Clostridia bacterium]MBR0413945.1 sigma-70 family RNA polymerase sigma factor [Clostridia bacterium]